MIVGNINEQTLSEIWNRSNKLKTLRKITHSDFPKCMNCSAHKFCTMCLERNCNENNGDMFKIGKHVCDVAFLMKRIHKEYQKKGILH